MHIYARKVAKEEDAANICGYFQMLGEKCGVRETLLYLALLE